MANWRHHVELMVFVLAALLVSQESVMRNSWLGLIMHTLIIGAGYSGYHIALLAKQMGTVCGTRRAPASLEKLLHAGIGATVFSDSGPSDEALVQIERATHLVICAAPARQAPLNDSVLRWFSSANARLPLLQWVGYLSTIGVYGNHEGGWVDEQTPCTSTQTRSIMRLEAEHGWQALAARWQVPMSILRLAGIYGPERNAVEDAIAGRARMLIKPEQVFNRIHVEDLATAAMTSAQKLHHGILNITDDLPAPPQDVIRYAHQLVGKPAPAAIDFATADISDMARSFYSENKRVSNALSKQLLNMVYRYPTYRQGLSAALNPHPCVINSRLFHE